MNPRKYWAQFLNKNSLFIKNLESTKNIFENLLDQKFIFDSLFQNSFDTNKYHSNNSSK